jgi:hypothetical protein
MKLGSRTGNYPAPPHGVPVIVGIVGWGGPGCRTSRYSQPPLGLPHLCHRCIRYPILAMDAAFRLRSTGTVRFPCTRTTNSLRGSSHFARERGGRAISAHPAELPTPWPPPFALGAPTPFNYASQTPWPPPFSCGTRARSAPPPPLWRTSGSIDGRRDLKINRWGRDIDGIGLEFLGCGGNGDGVRVGKEISHALARSGSR